MINLNLETQNFTVMHQTPAFEIRHYPAYTTAKINAQLKSFRELGNSGYSILAKYIFGDNASKLKLSVVSPVRMDINDSMSTMSFVMPSNYNKENLPIPNDRAISIDSSDEEYVAAIQFDGFACDDSIQSNSKKLEEALNLNDISYSGHFIFLGYNPSYQLIGRKNEVIVRVNWVK